MSQIRIPWRFAASLIALAVTAAISASSQTAAAPPAAIDATLYTTYSLYSSDQTLDLIVCGSTTESEGCYGSASLGPFGKVGAAIEGSPSTSGSVVTRLIYVVDIAAGSSSNGVELYVYKKTDTISSSSDTISVTLAHSVSLPLIGGDTAVCSMAANGMFLFIGTDQSPQGVSVKKSTLAVTKLPGYSPPINVTSITADAYGYVTVTQGGFSSGENAFAVYAPTGGQVEDGGGADFMLDTMNAVSTASLPASIDHPTKRLGVRPKAAKEESIY
jgi:hypothetical protein